MTAQSQTIFVISRIQNLKKVTKIFTTFCRAFVVTSTQNYWIIYLFDIIEILNKFKIFQDHRMIKFSNNIDLRKVDFLSAEK